MADFSMPYGGGAPPSSAAAPTAVAWYDSGAAGGYGPPPTGGGQAAFGGGGGFAPPPAAGGGFDDEPPLLEELGIDLAGILRRSLAILTGRHAAAAADADLGGPLLLAGALGATHLLASKLHFGVILGWTAAASAACWLVASNLIAAGGGGGGGGEGEGGGPAPSLGLYDAACLVGYGTLPLVAASALALLLPPGRPRAALVWGAAGWAAVAARGLFAARAPALRRGAALAAYPAALLYGALALLTLYTKHGGAGKSGAGGGGGPPAGGG